MSTGDAPDLVPDLSPDLPVDLGPDLSPALPVDLDPALPPRSRGVIGLLEANCTVCMLCARECPDWCLYIDSHKEQEPAEGPGGRPRVRHVLDRFAIDFSLCMYCGICIEVCPFDALFWAPDFAYAEPQLSDLVHEREQLGAWVRGAPPPVPSDQPPVPSDQPPVPSDQPPVPSDQRPVPSDRPDRYLAPDQG